MKAMTLLSGTLLLFNRRAPFLIAPPNFARTETSPTRTPRRDAINCTHQRFAFPSLHQRLQGQRQRKVMERVKESQAKAKVFGRARPAKGNNLRA